MAHIASHGTPRRLIRAIAALYEECIRMMKFAQHHGPPFYAANGIGQEDPLSMRFINGAGQMWVNAMKVNFADLRLGVYVDDKSIRARTQQALEGALEMTRKLDTSIGQEKNVSKSNGIATTRRSRRMLKGVRVGDTAVRYAHDARSLGAHIVTTRRQKKGIARDRAGKAAMALRRIGSLAVPRKAKRQMPEVSPRQSSVQASREVPSACMKTLRTAVIQAAMGHKKPHSALELITTLILEAGHADPGIASDQAAIMSC